MKLYELTAQYRADVAKLQDLDLPPEVVLDTIDGMQGEITDKIKAVIIVSKEMAVEAEARIECGRKMMDSGKAQLNRAEGLTSYAQIAIQNSGLSLPLKYTEFTVNLQRNPPSCTVVDAEKLPPHLVSKTVSFTIACTNPNDVISKLCQAATGLSIDLGVPIVDIKADKKAVLDTLKTIQDVNNKREKDAPEDKLAGAHMNPFTYRVTVK